MRKSILLLCAALGGLGLSTACQPPPKVLVAQAYVEFEKVGVKTVRFIHQLNAEGTFYDHVIRVCDVDAQGNETNCKDSLILETKVR
jgi:hypothetical protein